MTKSLSVVDAPSYELAEDVEPARPITGHVELLRGQLDGVRRAISQHEMVRMYDQAEIPGVTKGDLGIPGPAAVGGNARKKGRGRPISGVRPKDANPATVYDLAFGEVDRDKRPERGERLDVTLEGLRHQETVLAAAVDEHTGIASAHAEWAKRNGIEEMGQVADPTELQMLVGMLDKQVVEVESRLEAVEAHLGMGASPEADAA